ncbi:entry exclusion lipoprotein TrbK (plasmid) [Pseudomonas sp. KHPS1]|nr:entry exclusion lipoprotein TrbK [Pseudomonas sp. KHPS1]UTH38979.1 entry exclusion lipoprotein TrbK [Pseudomonas sp. KHPS1]
MKLSKLFYSVVISIACLQFAGCEDAKNTDKLPEVNDENCKKSEIAKIKPEVARKKFEERCAMIGTAIKMNPDTEWSVN